MIQIYCLALFLLLLIPLPLLAQPSDSLRRAYELEKDPLTKAEIYYDLALIKLSQNPETGLTTADTLEMLASKTGDKKNRSRAEYLRGLAYQEQGKYDLALPHHRQELAYARQTNDLELQGKALNSLGTCFHSLTQNDSAIFYFIEAAKVKEQTGNMKDVAIAYANIGNVFSDEQTPDKAIEWLEKALAIRLSLPDGERGAVITYNNLAVAYNGKGDYDKAIEYAQKGYELAQSSENKFLAGVLAGSTGQLLLKKGELDRAIEMNERSVSILTEMNRRSNLVYPYSSLSEAWWRKGNFFKALEANQKGYTIMEELKLLEPLTVYYENFARVYESMGDYRQSLFWLKKFIALDDSLFTKEKLEAIAALETKFETEKKEAQLIRQQLELERQTSQKKTILIASISGLILLAAVFQYLRSRQQIRQKEIELAAQLEHAKAEKLREMDDMKSTFFANISHEFRTPLTLILSPVEQMMDHSFRGDHQKYYRIIHRNGRRLLQLVNQLLDLSKLESGKMKVQVSEDDLGRFVAGVAGSFESLSTRQQVELQISIPETPAICFFDRDKVEKILVNLISNAFKFTGEGGKVEIELTLADEQAQIRVCDTGIGIPPEQLSHLFDRFTKITASEVQPGSGIGLALTKELVELHGGQIRVESREGKGAAFSVTLAAGRSFFKEEQILPLPPQVEPAGGQEAVAPPSPSSSGSAGLSGATVDLLRPSFNKPILLLAEDNADVRSYINDMLGRDYRIVEAGNGREALEKALDTTPDLIITDVMMPEMNGVELSKRLKSNEKTSHIPIIMLTARAEPADKLEGLETGADDYLLKPFDARELKMRANNLITQRKKLQEHYRRTLHAFIPAEIEAESMDAVFLQKVRDAVESHLDDETFSVVELGKKIGMSRSQLHRKLSALTGLSPNELIRNMRLERAKQLLEQKAATVSEIAYLCGFSSPAYFIKCFREYFEMTPGEIK
jgi:signal transduction histidine kinase/DNA-binding response OmpR family regulator